MYYLQSRYYDPELGRFINADDPSYLGVNGLSSYNLFVYCSNNPTNRFDSTGYSDLCVTNPYRNKLSVTTGEEVLGFGGIGILVGFEIGSRLWDAVKELWHSISQSFARAQTTTYKSPEEEHHLVAKKARNAAAATMIMNELFEGGVENPINKMYIKTGLHKRIHTKLYYGITNSIIIHAYVASDDPTQQRNNVIIALGVIRGLIMYWNSQSPF